MDTKEQVVIDMSNDYKDGLPKECTSGWLEFQGAEYLPKPVISHVELSPEIKHKMEEVAL
ncbi:MAG: hypothetical protein LBR16_01985 [Treponema sp.]|nr:hypothetical protein [Treponema sp.]